MILALVKPDDGASGPLAVIRALLVLAIAAFLAGLFCRLVVVIFLAGWGLIG